MKVTSTYNISADIIRIIAGFGVVLIHVTDPFLVYPAYEGLGGLSWWIINLINSSFRVSVPVFIMLSGYLLLNPVKKDSFEEFYKKRLLRVGIPFLFWLVMYFVWLYILGRSFTATEIIAKTINVNLDHLYFLFIIVELYFITPLLLTFIRGTGKKSHKVFALSTTFFTIFLALSGQIFPESRVPTHLNMTSIFLPFVSYYFLGFYLRNVQLSTVQSIWAINIYANFVLLTVLLSNGVVTAFVRQYSSANIFIMSVIMFLLLRRENIWAGLLRHKRIISFIRHIADTIFGVYLVHMLVISGLDKFFSIDPGDVGDPLWVWVIAKIAIVFFISYAVSAIGRKIPYVRSLFG